MKYILIIAISAFIGGFVFANRKWIWSKIKEKTKGRF